MRTEPGGVWLLNQDTGQLIYVDTHRGSTLASSWPVRDRHSLYHIQRGCDWLLNAAGAGMDAFTNALRARWPHDPIGTNDPEPLQSDFWYRQLAIGSLGAQVTLFVGDLDTAGRSGFVVDDSKDGDTASGWAGGSGNAGIAGQAGTGPGRGISSNNRGEGGGAAVAGDRIRTGSTSYVGVGGLAVPAENVLNAVVNNEYTTQRMVLSGGGGAGNNAIADGGASGGGLVRLSVGTLTESTARTLTGGNGGIFGGSITGGGGGGGTYLAIAARSYTHSSGTINCDGGARGGSSSFPRSGDGGNGHVIIIAGDTIDLSSGTISNAVTTQWRLIAAPPPGGSLISS